MEGAIDVFGIEQRYLVHCIDHFSQFSMLGMVPYKRPAMVGFLVAIWMGMFGYPHIFQTDNGKDVCGREVLDEVYKLNPGCITIQGRPRTPRDQGTVERANRSAQDIINSFVREEKDAGNTTCNWTHVLGRTMAAKNGTSLRQGSGGRNTQHEAYKVVFGIDMFQVPIGENVLHLRSHNTPIARAQLLNSEQFVKKMAYLDEFTPQDAIKLGDDLCTDEIKTIIIGNEGRRGRDDAVFNNTQNSTSDTWSPDMINETLDHAESKAKATATAILYPVILLA